MLLALVPPTHPERLAVERFGATLRHFALLLVGLGDEASDRGTHHDHRPVVRVGSIELELLTPARRQMAS